MVYGFSPTLKAKVMLASLMCLEKEVSKHCVDQMTPEDRQEAPGYSRTNSNPRLTSDLESTWAHLEPVTESRSNIRLLAVSLGSPSKRTAPLESLLYMNGALV